MGRGTVKEYLPGDLVRWFEPYADGFMTRDTGRGIILERKKRDLGFATGPYITYRVYRTKYTDEMVFEGRELEIIEK
jgi:hypothetical protein